MNPQKVNITVEADVWFDRWPDSAYPHQIRVHRIGGGPVKTEWLAEWGIEVPSVRHELVPHKELIQLGDEFWNGARWMVIGIGSAGKPNHFMAPVRRKVQS